MQYKVALIGLGKQNIEYHLPAIMESDLVQLDSVCDINESKAIKYGNEYSVNFFTSVEELVKNKKPDIAIIAIPHCNYLKVIEILAGAGVHIIKEKPFAISIKEAYDIKKIIEDKHIHFMITLQRRFNPIFQSFFQLRDKIGKIYSIEGRYVMNIKELGDGWRAEHKNSGGGALIDMGYHYIDLLVWYFGLPDTITARTTSCNRENQEYDVEDTAEILFDYNNSHPEKEKTIGNLFISRAYPEKQEIMIILGSKGSIELERGIIKRLDLDGKELEVLSREKSWPSAAIDQLHHFIKIIKGEVKSNYWEHFKHLAIIESAYKSDREKISISPVEFLINHNHHE